MISITRLLLVFVPAFIFPPVFGQSYNEQQTQLAEQLHSLAKNAAPELAYIQTSKDIYETGEDVWFKVYLLDAQYFTPSKLSKTLYLQLLNEKNKQVVWQEKYEIQNGCASGRVYLANNLQEGYYLIAAYTPNSFFKDSSEFYAIRRIRVRTDMTSPESISAKFEKSFYRGNESIRIKLSPLHEQRDSLYAEIMGVLQQGDKKLEKVQTSTNGQGKAIITFQPQDITEALQIVLNFKYKDRNELQILPVPCKSEPIEFSTFPEGGNLVEGIPNRLAFKAVNKLGDPVDIRGILFEDNIRLIEFKSTFSGMGSFYFFPRIGKKYAIILTKPAMDSTFPLPEIYSKGMTLQLISKDKESMSFKVSQSPRLTEEDIYLRVQCRGVVYALATGKLNGELKIKIPLSMLPQGIAEVTLFNSKLNPEAERLVYVNQNSKLKLTAELDSARYSTRGKARLKISAKNENDEPVVANLAVSVFDKIYQNTRDSNNILEHFYLSTQLKGRIYNPSFYFNSKNKGCEEALDLLMLTQGWRRYIWTEKNLEKLGERRQQFIFDGLIGQLTIPTIWKKSEQEQALVLAYSPNKENKKIIIPADLAGRFTVSPEQFKILEGNYIYLKPFASPESNPTLKLVDPFETIDLIMGTKEIIYPLPALFNENEEAQDLFIVGSNVIRIKEVTIKKGKTNTIRGKYLGSLDSLAKLDIPKNTDYVCIHNILNCPIHAASANNTKPVEGGMYFVVEPGSISAKASIIYHSPVHPNFTEEELLKLYNLTRVKTYFGNREFYKPNYDADSSEFKIPDFRNTLLWEPNVITNELGEANLSFFCSDINAAFVGRIEGVSNEGLLGTGDFKFTVRKRKPSQ